MQDYGVADVERLLRIPRATLKTLVAAGFVKPARGAGNAWRFSFQDLIVLRTAQALVAADIPQRRIVRALRQLRRELPESIPLSGLNIGAIADQVVYLLGLEEKTLGDRPPVALRETAVPHAATGGLSPKARPRLGLEERIDRALALHEAGRHDEALREYGQAVEECGEDPVLLYNLAILLDDMGHLDQSAQIYAVAIRHDPSMADAHYNLALVCEQLGRSRDAIRHMSHYRRLVRHRRG
jgi:tetratricopeptide (TPR) repeat protein